MYHPEPNKNPDWITRIYSEYGHIRHEHVIKNMTKSEAATKAQECQTLSATQNLSSNKNETNPDAL